MLRKFLLPPSLMAALVSLISFATGTVAQDFQKSYGLAQGGAISIRNVSGDIEVTGYEGDQVIVNAYKEGRDRDKVEIEDLSDANRVDVRAKYPRNCSCDANVRFEVRVPRSARYSFEQLSSASGNIKVSGVAGDLKVNTASGDVRVSDVSGAIKASTASGEMDVLNVSGTVNASTASGDVNVDLARLEGSEDMKFSSASGNVSVRAPSSLDAEVYMTTASGRIQTDFPIEIKDRNYGPGRSAEGRLGSGARRLRIATASGDLSLLRN